MDIKDPLRAGQSRQQEIALLGKLVDRQRSLPDKHQITGQASHIGHSLQRHNSAQNRHDRIIDIGDADDGGNHCRCIALRSGPCLTQSFVFFLRKPFQIGVLMVEYLDHFLSRLPSLQCNRPDPPELSCWLCIVRFAAFAAELDVPET